MNYEQSSQLFFNNIADHNILLHGPAGTGKTYLLKDYISALDDDIEYYIVAPTGIAAINIGGETIHSTFNIAPYEFSDEDENSKQNQINTIIRNSRPRFRTIDLLVIDEISMVGHDMLTILDGILRKKFQADKPMGGIRCIFSGDFYQLKPVKDDYCFKNKIWQDLELFHVPMCESKRYEADFTFQFMLRLRKNKLTRDDMEIIKQRNLAYKRGEHKNLSVKPVVLYSYNRDVDLLNNRELTKIKSQEYTYECFDSIRGLKESDRNHYIDKIQKLLDESLVHTLNIK
jgi:Cdc6-like AAA superfamily ATPase